MARSTPPRPTTPGSTATDDAPEISDAISLLRRDHAIVELLFEEFDRTDAAQRDPIARRICKMLNVHTQIEEEMFYPAARTALDDSEVVDHAIAEHDRAKQLIAEIEAMTSDSNLFQPTMRELASAIKEHVIEEEQMFARLADTRLDLEGLGVALANRKMTLMEVMGLHYDDELPARPETRQGTQSAPERR